MGRKGSFLGFVVKAMKKAAKEAEKEEKRRAREHGKLKKQEEREERRLQKEVEREEKIQEKERKKAEKDLLKKSKEFDKKAFNNLSSATVIKYKLGEIQEKHEDLSFDTALEKYINLLVEKRGSEYLENPRTISTSEIDQFLYSGKLNSVLGPDGFVRFRDELKKIVLEVNKGTNKDNFINLDDFFEVLLRSGVYYDYEHIPDDISYVDNELSWLTAYRFISKNFSSITYKEFRDLVKNLSSHMGKTIEFSGHEKDDLYEKVSNSGLFKASSSIEAMLFVQSLSELREICSIVGIASKRSKEETIKVLLEQDQEELSRALEKNTINKSGDVIFEIKDLDLVKGEDVIMLDKYLRDVSRCVRRDFMNFVNNKRNNKLVA